MKTLYHQKSGKSFIFLILKKRHYISSVIFLYISTLQAGKHRLFLNILLFGKLRIPILKLQFLKQIMPRLVLLVSNLGSFLIPEAFHGIPPPAPPFLFHFFIVSITTAL